MKKEKTIGKIGEAMFKNILIENNFSFVDMRKTVLIKDVKHGKNIYKQRFYSHPYDFIVNGKNIEIKTSTINYGDICFGWRSNELNLIDYILGFVIDKNEEIKYIFSFDKNYISSHKAFRINEKNISYPILSKKELIKLLTV